MVYIRCMKQSLWEVYCYSCHCEKCDGTDIYVGKALYGTIDRDRGHRKVARRILRGLGTKKDIKFDYFMARHGLDNLHVRTLSAFSSADEMNAGEIHFINVLQTNAYEHTGKMNFDIGGKGGRLKGVYTPTPETIRKQVEATKRTNESRTPEEQLMINQQNAKNLQAWRDANPDGPKQNVQKGLETFRKHCESDPVFAAKMYEITLVNAHKGGEAFIARYASDPVFAAEFDAKCSAGVAKWCAEHPEEVKARNQKGIATRERNGTWLENVLAANTARTPEEYHVTVSKGWVTRRKHIQEDPLFAAKEHENAVKRGQKAKERVFRRKST